MFFKDSVGSKSCSQKWEVWGWNNARRNLINASLCSQSKKGTLQDEERSDEDSYGDYEVEGAAEGQGQVDVKIIPEATRWNYFGEYLAWLSKVFSSHREVHAVVLLFHTFWMLVDDNTIRKEICRPFPCKCAVAFWDDRKVEYVCTIRITVMSSPPVRCSHAAGDGCAIGEKKFSFTSADDPENSQLLYAFWKPCGMLYRSTLECWKWCTPYGQKFRFPNRSRVGLQEHIFWRVSPCTTFQILAKAPTSTFDHYSNGASTGTLHVEHELRQEAQAYLCL